MDAEMESTLMAAAKCCKVGIFKLYVQFLILGEMLSYSIVSSIRFTFKCHAGMKGVAFSYRKVNIHRNPMLVEIGLGGLFKASIVVCSVRTFLLL